jgi:hypothetical protein
LRDAFSRSFSVLILMGKCKPKKGPPHIGRTFQKSISLFMMLSVYHFHTISMVSITPMSS